MSKIVNYFKFFIVEHNWPQKKFNYYAPGSHLFSGYMFLGSLLTLSSLAILETSILEPVTGRGSVYTGSPLECTGHQTLHQRVGYDVRPTGDKELGRYENIRMAAEYDSWSRAFFLGVRAHARQESNLWDPNSQNGTPFQVLSTLPRVNKQMGE